VASSRSTPRRVDRALVRRVGRAFGAELQRVRQRQNMKQDAFASAMGVSRTTVSNMECGRQRIFLDQVYRAATVLAVPVRELLPAELVDDAPAVLTAADDDPLPNRVAENVSRTIAAVVKQIATDSKVARQRKTRR